jgi:hypothetical protein
MNGGFPHTYPVQYAPTMDQFAQPPPHPMAQHDLNWSTPNLSQGMPPADMSGPYGQPRFANSQIQIPQNFGQLGSINETSILGSHEVDSKAILQTFSSAGYTMPGDQTFFDMSQTRQPSDFAGKNGRFEFGRPLSVSDASPSYRQTSFGNDSLTELSNYSTSANASMHALVEPHTMGSDAPAFATSHSAAGSISSSGGNPMPVLNTGVGDWVSDEHSPAPFSTGSFNDGSIEGSVGNLQQLDATSPQDSAMWANFMGQQDMYLHSNNNSNQVLASTSEPADGISIQVDPSGYDMSVSVAEDEYSRRTSSSSAMPDGNDIPGDLKQPDRSGSSLYSRRQRPRPTTLNKNALRSSSYSAASPASPRGLDSQKALRHVRSMGVMPPRIQKSGRSSTQPSPRHLSFADTNFQALNSAGLVTQGGALAPPTPLSPHDVTYQPNWSNPGLTSSQSPSLGPDAIPVAWGSDSGASPPTTPAEQYRLGMQQFVSGAAVKDTPPQSAPATQQSFPRSSYMQYAQQDSQMINDFNGMQIPVRSQPMRRPSMPEQDHIAVDHQMMYPMQFKNDSAIDGIAYMPNGIPAYTSMVTVPSNTPQAEFQVHQYRPPTGSQGDPSPRRDHNLLKKSYTFSNASLSDFNGKTEE